MGLDSIAPAAGEQDGRTRFQVLSLDGGGAKALFTAHVLARLEEDLGVRVADHFDLIAGTSAGGIVALGLGAGLRPAEIAAHYQELVAKVFPRGRQQRWRLGRLARPTYSLQALREVLTEVFGDRLLGDSEKRLLIPSWDVRSGEVHLFKTPHTSRLTRDSRISMVDVALATSAAPTYFQAATVDGAKLIDGGLYANNPSVLAIAEAYKVFRFPLDTLRVLNIGTMDAFTDHDDKLNHAGLAGWATAAVPLILAASSTSHAGLARHLIGSENFVRVTTSVSPKLFALDRINAAKVAAFAGTRSRSLAPEFSDKFVEHIAPLYSPAIGLLRPEDS